MSYGILAALDPEWRARYEAERAIEESRRDYAVNRLSALYFCPEESARAWLELWEREDMPEGYTLH